MTSSARLPLVDADGWSAGSRDELRAAASPAALERTLAALRAHGTPWVLLVGPGTLQLLGPDDRVQGQVEADDSGFEAMRAIGRLYAEGAAIDWAELYRDSGLRRLVLPTYPFERERHWVSPLRRELPLQSAPAPSPTELPLLGRELSLPGSSERRFETTWSRTRQAWLEQHVISGRLVAPGALFLASFLEAARICWAARPFALEDVRFLRALSLEHASGVEAQVIVAADGDRLELRWMARTLADGPSAWQLHATARALALPAESRAHSSQAAEGVPGAHSLAASSLAALRRVCVTCDSPERVNAALAAVGARLGPFFRWHAELWRAGSEILCGPRLLSRESLRPSTCVACASTPRASPASPRGATSKSGSSAASDC
jgi:acyl transferase domain-containing protein